MADISKISPDDGSTILNIKDKNAVHWADNGILGAKNLLENKASSSNPSGLTITVNADKSVTIYGTSTARVDFYINQAGIPIDKTKDYILSGCTGGSGSTYRLQFLSANSSLVKTNEDGDTLISHTEIESITQDFHARIVIYSGTNMGTVDNPKVFYPMIRLASDTDTTYRPYAMTNRELTLKEHTYNGTTDTNGVVVASSIPHHPIVYCYGAPTGGGNCFVDARPGGGGIAFYCHNNGAKVASTGMKIYYYDYLD